MFAKPGAKSSVYVRYAEIGGGSRGVRRQNWTPFAARLPFLISFILLLLLCVAALEVLVRQTKPYVKPEPETDSDSDSDLSRRQTQAPIFTHNESSYSSVYSAAAASVPTDKIRPRLVTTTRVQSIISDRSSYLDLGSTSRPAAAAAPTTTSQYITPPSSHVNTIVTEKSSYLVLSSTSSPQPAKAPTTTPLVANPTTTAAKGQPNAADNAETDTKTIILTKSSYIILSSTKSPEPEKAAPTTTAAVYSTIITSKTSYLVLTSTKSPEPEKAAPTTPTTTAAVYSTIITSKTSYLVLTSTKSPEPEKAAPTTTPSIVTVSYLTKTSSYLTLTSTKSPDGLKATPPTTTPLSTELTGLPITTKLLTLTSTKSPDAVKGPTTTLRGSRTSAYLTLTSSYLVLSSTSSPAANRNQVSTSSEIAVPTLTKTSGYLQLGSSTSPGANKGTGSSSNSEPALTKTSGYLGLGSSSSSARRAESTVLNPSSYIKLSSSRTDRGMSTSSGQSQRTTPIAASLTKSSVVSGSTKSSGTQSGGTKSGGTKTTGTGTVTGTGRTKNLQTPTDGTATRTTSSAVPTATGFNQMVTNLIQPNREVQGQFINFWYFLAIYFPSIIAVLLKEIWAAVASGLKMMEPFYQLNQPEGANVKNSLLSDYLASTVSIPTIASAFRGNGLMLVILMGNSIMYLLAPLSTESMTVVSTLTLKLEDGGTQKMNPAWVLTLPLIRLLQATMSFVAFLLAVAIIIRWKHRSGLSANPSKIATMASLLNNANVVQSINNIDPIASDKQIARSIAHERYMITNHVDRYGNNACGLVKIGDIVPYGVHQLPQDDATNPLRTPWPQPPNQPVLRREESKVWSMLVDGVAIFVLVGLLAVLIAFWLDGSESGFNMFLTSGKFGPRFIMSLAASIATAAFQSFEREIRLLLPYRRLTKRGAPARDTVLRSVNGTAASTLWQSVRHGTWYHFLIALLTVMGNVLIVTAAGTPWNEAQTWEALMVNISVSVGITTFMLFASFTIFVWRRRNKKMDIPPQPNETLLRVWMSLSNKNNQLRSALNDSDDVDSSALRARLKQDGGLYWAGWVSDEHGRQRWYVDREPDSRHGGYSDRLP